MFPNIKKLTLLNLREQIATVMKKLLSTVVWETQLRVMIKNNLNWTENSKQPATKAMGAFFLQIEPRLSQDCTIITKMNANTGYVEPILTYASHTWLVRS